MYRSVKALCFSIFVMVTLLWSVTAFAGTLSVRDTVNWIPTGDRSTIQSSANASPFDVHILVENASSFNVLESDAHNWVDSPHVMVIAIDPVHHKTLTRFGTGTGVKAGDYDSISAAGNAHFRSHEIGQGFEAIIIRAKASAQATTALSQSNTPVVIQEGLSAGAWFGIVLGFCLLVGFIVWLVRRQRQDRDSFERALIDNKLETSELRLNNSNRADERDFDSRLNASVRSSVQSDPFVAPVRPVVRQSVVQPVVVQQPVIQQPVIQPVYAPAPVYVDRGSDLVTGMLIGEALSRPREREVIVERERVIREEPSYHSRPSTDSGGSSSSWDSGGSSSYDSSSSSSYDSGGSSSSWDSGGSSSFDSGSSGGGGDSSW